MHRDSLGNQEFRNAMQFRQEKCFCGLYVACGANRSLPCPVLVTLRIAAPICNQINCPLTRLILSNFLTLT